MTSDPASPTGARECASVDVEHLLRFGKQRLLLNASATPEVEHEENWVELSFLAYVQLWAARKARSDLTPELGTLSSSKN